MNILIINAHPYQSSFSSRIAEKYASAAKSAGHQVITVNLYDLKFDPNLRFGYHEIYPLEDDLKKQQEAMKWCKHLVLLTPVWWGGLPALAKGFVDRVLLPGFAYKYNGKKMERRLNGRSVRVIYTQGGRRIISDLILLNSFWHNLKFNILKFCGFGPVNRLVFSLADKADEQRKEKFLLKVAKLGLKGK